MSGNNKSKKGKKQAVLTAKEVNKNNITSKKLDASFDAEIKAQEMQKAIDNAKKDLEKEKKKIKEEYKDLETKETKKDSREIDIKNAKPKKIRIKKSNKTPKKKTISYEDITNALESVNKREEEARIKAEQKAKKEKEKTLKKAMKLNNKNVKENKEVNKSDITKEETEELEQVFHRGPRITKKRKSFASEFIKAVRTSRSKKKEQDKNEENKTKEKNEFKDNFDKNSFMILAFGLIFLFIFINMLIPYGGDVSSRVKSNLIDTENMTGVEKVKADINNYIIINFPFYEQILDGYFGTLELSNRALYVGANDNELKLIDSKDGIYIDGKEDQLIRKYEVDEKNQDLEIGHRIKLFNTLAKTLKKKNVNLYVYAVSGIWTSEAILNFELDYKEPLKYVKMFEEKIDDYIHFDYLKIIDYTTFKEYFFATDHHWRIHGAYQGYKDICKMFGISEDEMVKPNFVKVEGVEFLGSNAKTCSYNNIVDYLYDIEFDEEYKVEVDGQEVDVDEFTARNDYLKGEFEKEDEYYNHYGKYFHSDLGEIVYTFDKNKKEQAKDNQNVLIISDSYSNCIDRVIASHFYKTYVVDLRYYELSDGEKFVIEDYIEKNNITDVLVMLSANSVYFESADLDLGLEGVTGVKVKKEEDNK
ncbi:MAG: hypothetical protein MJ245_00760 [Clostridia bacterium]|nr:hypothetical protein [Clostridia bacterium]